MNTNNIYEKFKNRRLKIKFWSKSIYVNFLSLLAITFCLYNMKNFNIIDNNSLQESFQISLLIIALFNMFFIGLSFVMVANHFSPYEYDYNSKLDNIFYSLDNNQSISQPEKDALIKLFNDEYQLAKQNNGKVIIEELPTYIKIQNFLKDDLINNIKNISSEFNSKIYNKFNDLDKNLKDIINVEKFILKLDMKNISNNNINDLKKHKEETISSLKKLEEEFEHQIISEKQKLLFKSNND